MRTLGLLAVAGAGVGFLFGTEAGRRLRGDAARFAREQYESLTEGLARYDAKRSVDKALDAPHPDTPMAQAFEEAAAT